MLGSSPLTRGKPSHSRRERCGGRLIPAHAGKTRLAASCSSTERAHPRSRGENRQLEKNERDYLGSSPLTRGKPRRVGLLKGDQRLIPAHAGKTARGRNPLRDARAHPRSRGENGGVSVQAIETDGSSPLTRGKPPQPVHVEVMGGLIPAHAGKTQAGAPEALPGRAHPRSRGENGLQHAQVTLQEGSSPLTRGKLSRPSWR